MKNLNPKIVLSAIAMTALIASPAFAQKMHKHHVPAQLYNSTAPVSGNAVIGPDGRVIGADPDALIRGDLQRTYGDTEGAY